MGYQAVLDKTAEILKEALPDAMVITGLEVARTATELRRYLKMDGKKPESPDIWFVTLDGMEESFDLRGIGAPLQHSFLGYRVRIDGFVGGKSTRESRNAAYQKAEALLEKFLEERTLRDTCLTRDPIMIESISEDRLGPHLVSHAEISFTAWRMKGGLGIK